MKSIIIGQGEIGKALYELLGFYHETYLRDKETDKDVGDMQILHIAFPYGETFVDEVKRYQILYKPKYTIIHSTVPVGTSRKCGAIHSPIIGKHPFLLESLKIFPKFLGGKEAGEVADYFRQVGIRVYLFDDADTSELMKLLDTTFYATCIEYTKEVKELCKKYNVPFEAWTIYTDVYNKGYEELGFPEFRRPNLIPIMKEIGGHCLKPNLNLLESKFSKFLKTL